MASYTYKHKSGHTVTYGQQMPKLERADDWTRVKKAAKKTASEKPDES